MYGHGGLDINITVAKKYFAKAAEQGHPSATYQLARILWSVESDYIHAYELFEKAAQHKVAGALCQLGHFAYAGFYFHSICIVEQDHQKAYTYYCEAAQLGDPMAALMVGSYFEDQEDLNRALQWYEAAYRLGGGGLAEMSIGKIKHLMSELDPELQEEAIVWFESAQKDNLLEHQSIFSPQVMVALYYLNGWGNKTRDPEKGFQILLEIAQMGGTEAFLPLATCYQEGVGTTCDPNKASNYWEMAAEVVSD
ncbi:hypothetical protein CU098_013463 [Rhizopus stolonifer]|uniref:ERAD-associated protein n=1 Tax=Rhizopus stolonifer TaxID=4846 RepID=A0A367KTX3_RHIST|nr:hypothetical protein CU098_013463 [Rhizopus stolonifer]